MLFSRHDHEKIKSINNEIVSPKQWKRQDIFLADNSGALIKLALWDALARTFVVNVGDVIITSNPFVKKYNGREFFCHYLS